MFAKTKEYDVVFLELLYVPFFTSETIQRLKTCIFSLFSCFRVLFCMVPIFAFLNPYPLYQLNPLSVCIRVTLISFLCMILCK
jgi:hypothetical protein